MTKECFARARASRDKGVLVHRICNEADELFYSEDREQLSEAHRTVLCVETFFAAMCDGGFAAWFDGDHGQLACCCSKSLRRIGLDAYAEIAEAALAIHHEGEVPAKFADWDPHLARIRGQHEEEDHSEKYIPLDTAFFALCQENPREFRDALYQYILDHEAELVQATQQPVAVEA